MMKVLIDMISESFESSLGSIEQIFEKDHRANASFGRASDLLSKRHVGWCLDGKRFIDLETSRRNLCVVAGSGKGKSQVHVFPFLLNANGKASCVVNDNSGELAKCIPYQERMGAICLEYNLTKKGRVYINPLDGCKGDMAAIRKISKTLMSSVSKDTDFFSTSGEDCISLFSQHVLEAEPRVKANLGNVYHLILSYQGSPEVVQRYMAETASQSVWKKFLALAGAPEKTRKSITATALSALSWLGENPTLADLTSVSNISFQKFRESRHVLYIQSPPSDARFYAPMISLIFQFFYRFAFSRVPEERELDINMILDEFGTILPGLPDYSEIISNSRKFKIPQCIILQDESILSPYNELKDNILSNCFVKCYYGGLDKKSFELERLLGNYEYIDSKELKKRRPLMYASEIRELDNEILIIPNGKKPLKVKITPAYKQSRLRKRLAMERTESSDPIPEYQMQYINLEPYRKNSMSNK